ncbi:MAG: hypothetical protein M1831_005548 [Alyxoria varia]|nr:MAG: hypothetical protein M1831_005548 [Alyxoria varia]
MARARKKRRTQVPDQPKNAIANGVNRTKPGDRIPKSMVIRMGAGDVGSSVTQLVKDVRGVMEPHTASKLRERRSNKLRDYTTMAGPLGVSHLLLFYRAANSGNTNMKVAIAPRGPTLSFHVEKYSLARDVAKSQRRPKVGSAGLDHLTPPLLVMNNFNTAERKAEEDKAAGKGAKKSGGGGGADSNTNDNKPPPIPKHLENLTTSVFQSLFPSIEPQRTPLSSIRRVLLLNREQKHPQHSKSDETYTLTLRHYAITTRPLIPISKPLKRLAHITSRKQKNKNPTAENPPQPAANANDPSETASKQKRDKLSLPDLSRLTDIADYVLDPGAASATEASDSERNTDAEVEVLEASTRRVLNKKELAARRERQQQEREKAQAQAQAQGEHDSDATSDSNENNSEGKGDTKPAAKTQEEKNKRRQYVPRTQTQKRAVTLTELGPRMTLRLYKLEEGLCGGKTLWHGVEGRRSVEEERELDRRWEERMQIKEERRRRQREDVERKRRERGSKKREGKGRDEDEGEGEEEWVDDMDVDGDDVEEEDGEDEDEDEDMEDE